MEPSNVTTPECDNEITAVRQAIADRLQLQNKLIMLEKMIAEILNSKSAFSGTESYDTSSNNRCNEGQSGSTEQSSSFPDASLALREMQQRASAGQRTFTNSPATSSNGYGYSRSNGDGTSPESSTLAEVKLRINCDSESTSSPYSQSTSARQTSTAYGSSNCTNCSSRARRLAELTFRVFTRGFEHADEHTLHEMSAHLREFIQDRSNNRHT
ncbi:unnamed protein product [Orchesella dallaii]|uniref:Uncharacterized protein n=1 Tax=Orchesella dallaii TaxID=48710 RepID=A0ABP1QZZ7_9HEXA